MGMHTRKVLPRFQALGVRIAIVCGLILALQDSQDMCCAQGAYRVGREGGGIPVSPHIGAQRLGLHEIHYNLVILRVTMHLLSQWTPNMGLGHPLAVGPSLSYVVSLVAWHHQQPRVLEGTSCTARSTRWKRGQRAPPHYTCTTLGLPSCGAGLLFFLYLLVFCFLNKFGISKKQN